MKTFPFVWVVILVVCGSAAAHANLIANGGFEDGVFSSTIDGGTNASVPIGWTPNAGYDTPGNFNSVTTFNPHSGTYALFLANDPGFPVATLSQSFATVSGMTYQASFYVANVLYPGSLQTVIDGGTDVTIVANEPAIGLPNSFTSYFANGPAVVTTVDNSFDYTREAFDFVGTGFDTLAFSGISDAASFEIDDVAVVPAPEPKEIGLALLAFAAVLAAWTRSQRQTGRKVR